VGKELAAAFQTMMTKEPRLEITITELTAHEGHDIDIDSQPNPTHDFDYSIRCLTCNKTISSLIHVVVNATD